jgi:hypothetical protein
MQNNIQFGRIIIIRTRRRKPPENQAKITFLKHPSLRIERNQKTNSDSQAPLVHPHFPNSFKSVKKKHRNKIKNR